MKQGQIERVQPLWVILALINESSDQQDFLSRMMREKSL